MYRNIFLKSYAVRRDGAYLVITRDSCFKINDATHALLSRLPAKGTGEDYQDSLSMLGIKEPAVIFKKLVEIKCLVWSDGKTRAKNVIREVFNPVIELIPGRLQEKLFPFLKAGQFSPSSMFKFSLYGALFGLALSVTLPFFGGVLPSSAGGLGMHEGTAVIALVMLSVLVHELGHSSFAFLNGIGFRPIGFSMYLFFPVIYTNISGVSQLDLKPKLSINLGGLALQGIFLGLLAAGYLYSGLGLLYNAAQYISYLIIFNMNPLINTDTYWCHKDMVSAYKGNRVVDLIDKVYSLLSLLFTAYLLYISYILSASVISFFVRAARGSWTLGGIAGVMIKAYVVIIMARGIYARIKTAFKSAQPAI